MAIELFGLSIRWYGVIVVTGIALGVWLAAAREKRFGLEKDAVLDLALVCVPAAILGARAYYVAFAWDQFSGGPWWNVLNIRGGGMAIYGGVIGGVLAGWTFAHWKRIPFLKLADLAAPCIALGQAVGRWGNFVNQEAHGGPVANPALQFFPMAVEIGGEWYYATFFYESMWCLLIVALLLAAERKGRLHRPGETFLSYIFLYALERSIVEGLRTDSLYIGPLRVSQLLSVAAMCAVIGIWILNRNKHKKKTEERKNRGEE